LLKKTPHHTKDPQVRPN